MSIAFVKEQQGTQGVGGGKIGDGVGAKTIQSIFEEGNLVKAFVGNIDGLKGIQEINNAVKINTDKSIVDMKINAQGVASGGQGQ